MIPKEFQDDYLAIPAHLLDKNLLLAEIIFLCLMDFFAERQIPRSAREIAADMGYTRAYANLLVKSLTRKGYLTRKTKRDNHLLWDICFKPTLKIADDCGKILGESRQQKKLSLATCGKPVEKSHER